MSTMNARIQALEAQVNALAQAWLYLAATVEIQTGVDLVTMENELCEKVWPNSPAIDTLARDTLYWLCDQLDAARATREARKLQQENEQRLLH
ncbi:hypothetical protein [Burkholderia anthina]|uniref:hypothetical protein n=1 Tax=Burkholderia anthina TaxID=179879 RepID=UPI001AA04DCD|nr:hypothetical protein [Burkholderia anthina]QTD95625.1 hypothetical protein J4G50_38970 [Burkholderia anthina]QTD95647.1 hypothetical protein J4G50_39100 [Burkholderia anthina]